MFISKASKPKSLTIRRLRRLAKEYADAWAELRYTVPYYKPIPNTKRMMAMRNYERARKRFYHELDRAIEAVETSS